MMLRGIMEKSRGVLLVTLPPTTTPCPPLGMGNCPSVLSPVISMPLLRLAEITLVQIRLLPPVEVMRTPSR